MNEGSISQDQSQPAPPFAVAPPASAWIAVAVIGVGAFALVTTEFLPVGLLPQIAQDLAVTEGQAGLLVTVPGVLAAIAAPLTIAFAGQADRRQVLALLLGLLALSNLMVAVAPSFGGVLAGRVLLGIAVGGFWTVGGSLGPRLVPGRHSGRATSLILAGVSLGTVAGVPAGALIGDLVGWRWAFTAASGVSLVVLVALIMLLPKLAPSSSRGIRDVWDATKVPRVRVGLVGAALLFIGQFSAYTYITPFLLQVTRIESSTVALMLLSYGFAGLIGNLCAGWAVGRSVRLTLIATALVLSVAIALMAVAGASQPWAVAAVLAWGVGFGMLPVSVQTWIFSAAPDKLEGVQGLFVCVAQGAIGLGAFVGGVSADALGIVSALWLGVVAMIGAAALFAARGGGSSGPDKPPPSRPCCGPA